MLTPYRRPILNIPHDDVIAEPMTKLHERQPAILDPAAYKEWLDPSTSGARAKELLEKQNLDGVLEFHRVSRDVNSSRFTGKPEMNPL
ncbi:SOS response-associated peptidase family protein [Rhizobium wenxiniae]|nr:SOS response-associated peptidase family protein [Rhizobium wenxiniae]